MSQNSRKRGLGNRGKTFKTFAEEQRPRRTWRSLKLGRNPVSLLEQVVEVPLVAAALDRIDSFGTDGRKYPLSVVVRWLFMMLLCHLRCLEHMADRMLTDEAVKWAVLGDPDNLGEEVREGTAPERAYISKQISDHLDVLIEQLQHLYDSLVAALLRSDPLLKYALIYDGSMVETWGNPERPEHEFDEETGKWRKTGRMLQATDTDAARWARRIHSSSRVSSSAAKKAKEVLSFGFGYRLSALIFSRLAIPLAVWLDPPSKGNGERLVAIRMLREAREKFGPLLEIAEDELAVFLADAGLAAGHFFATLRQLGYEPIVPYKRTVKENILKDKKVITRKGNSFLELDVRWDGTVLCPRTDWDPKKFSGGRRPLEPLPSDLTARAQRWRCPMKAVGECSSPCLLEPQYKDSLKLNTIYPRVKKFIRKLSESDGFHFVLFPRIGAEAQTLSAYRGLVERDFSYIKGRGCFGGEGQARLPIRGQQRLKLRLLCTLIPLVVLALIELGVEMPAELLDDWFAEIEPPNEEAA